MKSVSYETLAQSELVQDLLADLRIVVGADLALVPPTKSMALEDFDPESGRAGSSTAFECAAGGICTMTHLLLDAKDRNSGYQIGCQAGHMHLAVPVMIAGRHVATLLAGNFSGRATRQGTECRMMSLLQNCGPEMILQLPERARISTAPMTKEQVKAVGRVLALFTRLSHGYAKSSPAGARKDIPDAIAVAQRYIQENYAQKITLDEIARRFHLSASYFEHLFKKSTGETFTRYLAEVRVAKAEALLVGTRKSIKEITYAVGFRSVEHFNHVFKSHHGQSPTQYRQMMKIAESDKEKTESDN